MRKNLEFHFTLGPVQGFVSQARRTRDFWAGSFLLSWLSGVAMKAAKAQGGEIVFPRPPDNYLDWIGGRVKDSMSPTQGGIPNRYKAKIPAEFSGKAVADAVRAAWVALAELVWRQDIAGKLLEEEISRVRAIWDRQHAAFWEMSWTLSDGNENNLIDRRKNWRHHLPPPEPGEKCYLMEGWQELSGINGVSRRENDARREFWRRFASVHPSDFGEGEQLCAIAFVKRRFVRHFADFAATVTVADRQVSLKGWKLPTNLPSVVYMAAVHWLEKLLMGGDGESYMNDLRELLIIGQKAADNDEWQSEIACLTKAAKISSEKYGEGQYARSIGRNLIALDGSLFFPEFRRSRFEGAAQEHAEAFGRRLGQIIKDHNLKLDSPTPFYAVLMMDGDSLGIHMSKRENQRAIPHALDAFTKVAADIVKSCNGSLIYAGGDDVLAILPLEDALNCAASLRQAYLDAFRTHLSENSSSPLPTTLSGAVVYAHVKTPLGEVLRTAHDVLDDVAKELTGRDAIAVRVIKPGGDHMTWAAPWKRVLTEDAANELKLNDLVKSFGESEKGEPGFSTKFFYKVRSKLDLIAADMFTEEDRVTMVKADFLASARSSRAYPQEWRKEESRLKRNEWLDKRMSLLVEHMTEHKRSGVGDDEVIARSGKLSADALMLIRFLAHKGVETR